LPIGLKTDWFCKGLLNKQNLLRRCFFSYWLNNRYFDKYFMKGLLREAHNFEKVQGQIKGDPVLFAKRAALTARFNQKNLAH
jgi:hypothetical protein